jgi:DNA-directed RNA polymerase subunit alpha
MSYFDQGTCKFKIARYTFPLQVAGCRDCKNALGPAFANLNSFFGREPMSRTRIPLSRGEEHLRLMSQRLEMSTAEIGLTVRTTNCLEEKGIFTVRDLLNSSREDLLGIANFGEKTLEEVYKSLEKFGFFRASRRTAMAA